MAQQATLRTLYEDKEKTMAIAPRTVTKGVTDDAGENLDNILNGMNLTIGNKASKYTTINGKALTGNIQLTGVDIGITDVTYFTESNYPPLSMDNAIIIDLFSDSAKRTVIAPKTTTDAVYEKNGGRLDETITNLKNKINSAQVLADSAQRTADNAQNTANAAMPKSGGTFTDSVVGYKSTDAWTYNFKNIDVRTKDNTNPHLDVEGVSLWLK